MYRQIWFKQQWEISSTLPKETFKKDTKINLQLKNGQSCKFIFAVCGNTYTLYQVSGEMRNDPSQLILAHENKDTIFLNISKRSSLSLFGGCITSAVIDTETSIPSTNRFSTQKYSAAVYVKYGKNYVIVCSLGSYETRCSALCSRTRNSSSSKRLRAPVT